MRKSQRGITMIGWILMLVPIAIVGYASIRLAPIYRNYLKVAKTVEQVGGAGDFGVDPNVEKVVSLEPDLFLTIPGGDQWKQRLRDLDVPVVTLHADDLEDLAADIETIGTIAGIPDEGAALADDLEAAIQDAVSSADQVSCFFEVYYPPLTTVGPDTFIFDVLETAGCVPVTADAASDYPEWSVEELIADDPVIYVATPESAKSVRAIAKRPGFGQLSANLCAAV